MLPSRCIWAVYIFSAALWIYALNKNVCLKIFAAAFLFSCCGIEFTSGLLPAWLTILAGDPRSQRPEGLLPVEVLDAHPACGQLQRGWSCLRFSPGASQRGSFSVPPQAQLIRVWLTGIQGAERKCRRAGFQIV